jgi:hypothetical protein
MFYFFGAAGVIAEIELSLKLNHHNQVKLVKTLIVETYINNVTIIGYFNA